MVLMVEPPILSINTPLSPCTRTSDRLGSTVATMPLLTIGIIALVLLLCVGLFVIGTRMMEYDHGFVYFAYGMLALLVLVTVYLAYAVPSVATMAPSRPAVTEQETNLLQE